MHKSRDSDSNVTVERRSHSPKQVWHSRTTEEGIQIVESNDEEKNAKRPILESLEPDSNFTSEKRE
jgi:hypothetical protein